MTQEFAPAPVRMRYIVTKLSALPALLAAARTQQTTSGRAVVSPYLHHQ
ncbi:MAG: hypothetical protein IT353_14215 [Gemmatimonadaceae bacterium]|nr:hypothetical protein [Gemmatimonadaceae bacterium]